MKRIAPICQNCGTKAEWYRAKQTDNLRIYCRTCSKYFDHVAAPKVLLLDIETSTVRAEVFGTGEQVVRHEQITDDYYITSWAGKYLFKKEIFGATVTPKEARERNDKRILKPLHSAMQNADFIITYNGDKFDIKKINWRFLIHNYSPIHRYNSIDLYKKLKQMFSPSSLAMDFVLKELGYNGKHHSDGDQWRKASAGDPQALKDRYEYNLNDVWMMEDLYPRVRGWFKTHPNFAAFLEYYQEYDDALRIGSDEYRCNRCMQVIHKFRMLDKYQTPKGNFYRSGTCPHCGCEIREAKKLPKIMPLKGKK